MDHKLCSVCNKRHISKPSKEWCSECNQAFCTECKEYHSLMSLSENHMTIPIDRYVELRTSILSFDNICENHKEKYELFCQTHDKLLCLTCIEEHSECKDIKSVNKIAKNIKNSEFFNEVRISLEDMDTNINKMISEIKYNKNSTEDCRGIIIQRMCEVREKVNKHLDNLEVRLKEELSALETKAENDIQLTLKHLEEKKLQNTTKQKQLKDLTTYTSNLQTFLGLRHLSSEVITDEASLRSLVESRSLDEVRIEFEVDENIISLCNNINKFGSVKLRNIASSLRLESQKGKQAQTIEKRNSIENAVVKFVNTLQVNTTGDSIYGCDVLPDGKMVFCNYSSQSNKDFITVFSSNSRHLYNISLEQNYAFDVVSLDENTVVVTSPKPGECCLMFVDINRTKFTTTKTQFECYNITLSEGKLLSNARRRGLISIDATSGNILSTIKRNVHSYASLTSFESKIYFCDPGQKTITCCDMEGKSIWTFKDDTVIGNPSGITVDGDGNVYVSNQDLNNVIVISADGTKSKQLLSESDGLKKPKAIQYDRKRNRLLVANLKEKAFLFDI